MRCSSASRKTRVISSGIRRPELNLSLLTPGLEISFVDRALERLCSVAWYLDYDPVTLIARFKEEPSINKIVAEEKEQVGVTEAKDDLRSRRDAIFANKFFTLVYWEFCIPCYFFTIRAGEPKFTLYQRQQQ